MDKIRYFSLLLVNAKISTSIPETIEGLKLLHDLGCFSVPENYVKIINKKECKSFLQEEEHLPESYCEYRRGIQCTFFKDNNGKNTFCNDLTSEK